MQTCTYCLRLIWPWQRRGFLVLPTRTIYWHPGCRRKAADRD